MSAVALEAVALTPFAVAYQEYLESDEQLAFRGKRLLRLIKERPTARRLQKMEERAVDAIGFWPTDWTTLDWVQFGLTILKALLKILAILAIL